MASRLAWLTPETASGRSCRHVMRPGDRDRDLRRGHRLLIRRLIRRCQEMRRRRVRILARTDGFFSAGRGADEQVELGVLDRRFVPEISGTRPRDRARVMILGPGRSRVVGSIRILGGARRGFDARSVVVGEQERHGRPVDVVTSVPIQSLTPRNVVQADSGREPSDEAESMRRRSSYQPARVAPEMGAEDVREQLAALPGWLEGDGGGKEGAWIELRRKRGGRGGHRSPRPRTRGCALRIIPCEVSAQKGVDRFRIGLRRLPDWLVASGITPAPSRSSWPSPAPLPLVRGETREVRAGRRPDREPASSPWGTG